MGLCWGYRGVILGLPRSPVTYIIGFLSLRPYIVLYISVTQGPTIGVPGLLGVYWGVIAIMENKMETTTWVLGFRVLGFRGLGFRGLGFGVRV